VLIVLARLWLVLAVSACGLGGGAEPGAGDAGGGLSVLVGRPTDRGVTVSVLPATPGECFVEYGADGGGPVQRTAARAVKAGAPTEFEITGLAPATRYGYRVLWASGGGGGSGGERAWFRTCRAKGETFAFGVQGDSHPERLGRMFDPALYERTLANAAMDGLDFYFLMGDDFSIERLIERGERSAAAVNAVYARQRAFLDDLGRSTPLMLVNGNHEQAAKYLLDGTPGSFPVLAGLARTTYFPLPGPDGFFSGNRTPVEHVGLVRDYSAWEWGDALFVVIDPYWHSDVAVDNAAGERGPARDGQGREGKGGGGRGQRDLWKVTLGDEQYRWLRTTLLGSRATFKFVFSHHVLGTGRGGIEQAGLYEWGGRDRRGVNRFFEMRPTWEQPIHDLMRDAGVTIFFQGHDHLYARQELDGVVYQTCPNPADPTFTAFNREAYRSGDVFANSGHLRVTVTGGADAACRVEYVRSLRDSDEKDGRKNGTVVHEYTVRARTVKAPGAARETSR
jgi:hypothetical protein